MLLKNVLFLTAIWACNINMTYYLSIYSYLRSCGTSTKQVNILINRKVSCRISPIGKLIVDSFPERVKVNVSLLKAVTCHVQKHRYRFDTGDSFHKCSLHSVTENFTISTITRLHTSKFTSVRSPVRCCYRNENSSERAQ